jgi:hypothetical protein
VSGAVGTGFGAGSGTGFDAAFGREPTGHWAAPGRVNLIGEHVDYADGLCLPFAIAQRTVVAAAAREDTVLRLRSLSEEEALDVDLDAVGPGSPAGWGGYAAGVLWALRAAGHPVRGLDLLVTDTVPLGAGLSSSAAVECATALAADDLFDLGLGGSTTGRQELAAACVRAENEVVGAATGGMDQAWRCWPPPGTRCCSTPTTAPPGRCRSTRPRPGCGCWSWTPGSATGWPTASTATGAPRSSGPPPRSACPACARSSCPPSPRSTRNWPGGPGT